MMLNQWSLQPPSKLLPFVVPFKGASGALGGGEAAVPGTPPAVGYLPVWPNRLQGQGLY